MMELGREGRARVRSLFGPKLTPARLGHARLPPPAPQFTDRKKKEREKQKETKTDDSQRTGKEEHKADRSTGGSLTVSMK